MAGEHGVSHGFSSESGSSSAVETRGSAPAPSGGRSGLFDFLWRRRLFILAGTLLCGLTALVVSLLTPRSYEAGALLMIQPPRVSSPLDPAPLGVDACRLLLESDYVISQTLAGLVAKNVVAQQTQLEAIRDMLTVETYTDRRDVPMIALRARSGSAEKASAAANVWAQVAVDHFASLTQQSQLGAGNVLQAQYPIIRDKLSNTRERLKQRQDYFERALLELERRWSPRITEFDKGTGRLTREQEKQTDSMRIEFESRWKVQLMRQRLEGLEASLLDLEGQVTDSQAGIGVQQKTLAEIKAELQNEPRYWVLSKAITDEALWSRMESHDSALPQALDQLKLRSEFLNPAHQQLLERMIAAQLEYDLLSRKLSELPGEIERLGAQADELRKLVNVKEGELSALLADRAMDLKTLLAGREAERDILDRTHEEEAGRLRRQRDFEVQGLTREIEDLEGVYAAVAPKYQEAQLAQLRTEPSVKIATPAMTPQRATRPNTILNVITGLVVGLILSTLLALLIQYVHADVRLAGRSS
jgi:uncharacterized protein involved in exopolysaccharide biosynthesis